MFPITSEADVSVTEVQVEPSQHYSITCWCRETDGSRGTLTKWCLTWKCVWSKGEKFISFMQKKKWHPLIFTNAFWTFMKTKWDVSTVRGGGWRVSAVATVIVCHLHLCRFLWAQYEGLVHPCWTCITNVSNCQKIVFCRWEFAQSNNAIVLFVVVSMKITWRH